MLGVALIATTSFAQPKKTEKAKAVNVPTKKEMAAAKPAPPAAKPAEAPKMKADGTPDKRFKENKAAKPTAGPLKKDGTPDMRYKANKKG